jgi:hypothetical protein
MSTYTPDRWVLVELKTADGERIHKVLASWYGGFASGDSWKLSSGTDKIIDHGDHYELPQCSGSTYILHKGAYGMSGYTSSVLAGFEKQLAESNTGTITVLDEDLSTVQLETSQ